MPPDKSCKLPGVPMALDGNTKEQNKHLTKKCEKCANMFPQCNFHQQDIQTRCSQVFIPAIQCCLCATTLTAKECQRLQTQTKEAALTKMGHNGHTPNTIVRSDQQCREIEQHGTHREQGIMHTMFSLQNFRPRTETTKTQ